MSALFQPFTLREVEFRNRLFVSPMCQYSAGDDGVSTDWHLVHLGSRAVGGAGMVMTEATAVSREGRISAADLGIWSEEQVTAFKRITSFIEDHGAVPAIQLAHAGRKASTHLPWTGVSGPVDVPDGGWEPVGPSPLAFNEGYAEPHELTTSEVRQVIDDFAAGAERAARAGFRVIEIHEAHGYLIAQFLSPFSNQRTDEYGGDFAGRIRLGVEVARAIRESVGRDTAVIVRVSASEYVEDGWDLEQTIALSAELKQAGVDFIDASSGGNLPHQKLRVYPGYQVPFARAIREQAGIPTGAVGLITSASHADAIIAGGDADAVFMAREELRDPYWPLHAAAELGDEITWPKQYARAKR